MSGRVLYGGSGQPGVHVRIGTGARTRSTETDALGQFVFGEVAPGAYTLHADLASKQLGAAISVDVGLDPDPVVEIGPDGGVPTPRALVAVLVVELVPTSRLVGLVRDENGRPLPGAFVRVEEEDRPFPVEVETGADGRFTVEDRLQGRAYRVTVRRAGYLPDGPRLAKPGAAVAIQLHRGAVLTGSVVDERGAPVEGAELAVVSEDDGGGQLSPQVMFTSDLVTDGWHRLDPAGELGVLRGPIPYPPLLPPAPVPQAPGSRLPRSDAHGQFRVAELGDGKVIVTARHPDYAVAASAPLVLVAGATRTVQLLLRKGAALRGRVLDDRGMGLAEAEVVSSDGRAAVTDGGGRFSFEHLVASVRVSARRVGFLKGEAKIEVSPESRELSVDLKLTRALGRLGGQVVDARGNALDGARLTVSTRGSDPARAITDAGGRFLVEGLPDGPYRVEVERAGSPTLRLGAIEASAEVRLVLETGGGVEGEVFDTRSGLPPADARLELVLDGERRPLPLRGRRFEATGLPSGPARLVVRARGYPRTERAIEILAGDRPGEITVRDVRIELELGGELRGRVRDDHGTPVAGAEVEVLGSASIDPARADSDGRFSLSGVPTGRVRLRAHAPEGGSVSDEEVEVRANEETRVDLILPAGR